MSESRNEVNSKAALLNEAIIFAVEKHAGQVRKGTDLPYIVHPLEVMTILGAMHVDAEVMADKLSNMRAIARDYRQIGDKVWERFNRPKEKQAWYYAEGVRALESMQDNNNTVEFYEELKRLYGEVFGE